MICPRCFEECNTRHMVEGSRSTSEWICSCCCLLEVQHQLAAAQERIRELEDHNLRLVNSAFEHVARIRALEEALKVYADEKSWAVRYSREDHKPDPEHDVCFWLRSEYGCAGLAQSALDKKEE